jgi:hypothetical protein
MWQRLLDRFAPLMEEPPSRLDHLDGVGLAALGTATDLGRESAHPQGGGTLSTSV